MRLGVENTIKYPRLSVVYHGLSDFSPQVVKACMGWVIGCTEKGTGFKTKQTKTNKQKLFSTDRHCKAKYSLFVFEQNIFCAGVVCNEYNIMTI